MASIVAQSIVLRSEYECPVALPYRLDLTVSALRRLSSNLVDVLTPEGAYLGALGGLRKLVTARVTQSSPATLAISLVGDEREHPWSAAVILLRGLGRLDVFPMNDRSVTRNLALVSGPAAVDVGRTLRALSPQQGMLYYHLLLARLEAQRDLGRPFRASMGRKTIE